MVPLPEEPWQRLRTETGTRVLKISESTGECLVDFIVGGNLFRESWYAPVQVRCDRPYSIAGREWFDPFGGNTPWASLQLSVPKVVLGHSVSEYNDARHAVDVVLGELHELAGVDVDPSCVVVRRADLCRTLKLPSQPEAVALIDQLQHRCRYPGRETSFYRAGETVMWAVREESFKAYAKLPELVKKRRGHSELDRVAGFRRNSDGSIAPTGLTPRPLVAQEALIRAASGQVRFELTLRHKALIRRFSALSAPQGSKHGILLPLFLEAIEAEIGAPILKGEYDKVLSFSEISSSDAVLERLAIVYGPTRANNLYRFWEVLCEHGDRGAREHYPRRTYYRHRSALKLARIGIVGNDVEFDRKQREKQMAESLDLFRHLAHYGEDLRGIASDEIVDQLQREAGLPVPDRKYQAG